MGCFFWGWYFKCQSDHQTLAVIPAMHKARNKQTCSIQLITADRSWNVCFPYTAYQKDKYSIQIEENRFGKNGIHLNLDTADLTAVGSVSFGSLTPVKYHIMGPFRYVPFMECRHSIFSMKHTVTGELIINGVPYRFQNAAGYWEGDSGHSFPREYAWTQCCFPDGSLMLCVADIPMGSFHFTGVIGTILWQGKEYRLATYLGAKAVRIQDGEIVISQGSKRLNVRQLEKSAHPLRAPQAGAMGRTIHEHVSCRVSYHFQDKGLTVFAFEAPNASFEYEYPR